MAKVLYSGNNTLSYPRWIIPIGKGKAIEFVLTELGINVETIPIQSTSVKNPANVKQIRKLVKLVFKADYT